MPYILVRDSEDDKLYVYNHLTHEAADMLEFMYTQSLKETGFCTLYRSDEAYDPAIAHEFKETGTVNEEHVARAAE